MLKLKRKAKPQEKEWEFDNPSAQYGDSNDDSDDAVSPRSGSSSTRSKADSDQDGDTVSPRSGSKADSDRDDDMASPRSGSDTPRSPGDLDIDLDLTERVFKRNKTNYTVFLTVMILLIPVYGLFALLMGWAWWVLPNPISAMATIVTAVLPWVLWLGVKGAYRQSLARLQLFSFMMLLAISLQLSLALTMILDDGTLSDAYISGVTVAFSALCEETAALPVGADMLPINAVCECLKHDDAAAGNISMAMVTSHPDVVQCSRAVLERDLALDGRHLMVFAVVTLLVEVGLAWMAYHMMEDLDGAAAKTEATQKGGHHMGTLKGEIVRGSDLGSAGGRRPKQKTKKLGLRRPNKSSGGGLASRYAVLTVRTPGLFDPSREIQNRRTEVVEDDADPEWNHKFGLADSADQQEAAGIDIFAESSKIEIKVFDCVDSRDKKKSKNKTDAAVGATPCVGQAGELSSGSDDPQFSAGVLFAENPTTRTGMLPAFNYEMDGEAEVEIPVFREQESGSTPVQEGSVTLRLSYTPKPPLVARSAASVAKSWYFEVTVLGMCLLAMVALGLRAPADPPSPALYAALRVTELFIATHMVTELLLEVEAAIAEGDKFLTKTWFLLAVFVTVCNWISILFPLDSDAVVAGQTVVTDVSDNAVESPDLLAGALANQQIRKLVSVGRVFRVVRPIRTLRLIPHVDMIVSTLEDSMGIFSTVCLLIVFLLAIFALIGISSFGGALQYECIEPDSRGDYICTEGQQRAAEVSNIGARGTIPCPIRCPSTLACAATHEWCAPLEEPRQVGYDPFGYRNFDNFGVGILTVFTQMSGTGGLHTLPLILEEAGAKATTRGWAMSCAMSLLLNLVALNLFLAVCCSAYSDVATKETEIDERIELLKQKEKEKAIKHESAEQRAAREQAEAIAFEKSKPYADKLAEKDWGNSYIAPVRNAAKRLALSETFESLTSLAIIGNTVTMAMAYEGMPDEWHYWLASCETLFLVTYVLEALVKVLASGTSLYFASLSNRFDCFVICCSIIGFLATFFGDELRALLGDYGNSLGSLQVLRAVRLLRALQVVRLLHRQKALIVIMRTIFKAWRPLLYHSIFCVFSMSTFAIIGMHMFGGSLGPGVTVEVYEREMPEHYETFANGLLTCFEMTVGQEWSSSMWYYMKNASVAYGYPAAVVAGFFMLMYIFMSGILFSLYVAMLLQNFETPEKDKIRLQQRVYERKARRQARATRRARKKLTTSLLEDTVNDAKSKGHAFGKKSTKHLLQIAATACQDINAAENKSLYLFRLDSHIRIVAATVQDHPMFKRFVMALIMISCASLAIEGRGEDAVGGSAPSIGGYEIPTILGFGLFTILNALVLIAFIFETGLKVVIHGFILKSGPTTPYLASRMNQVDFFIVLACLAAYMPFVPIEGPWARALRLGRVITPISNSLAKYPEIALVVLSFFRAAPDTAIVLLPLVLLAVVFSIVGVSWFGGKDRACVDLANMLETLPYDRQTCLNKTNHDWVSPAFNFDNSINGMASLFVATTDGTHGFMLAHNAISGGNSGTAFWVLYHLVFTCFFLNLFLGVLTASFEKSSGAALRTSGEKSWNALKRFLRTFQPTSVDEEELRPKTSKLCAKLCGSSVAVLWFKFRNKCFELAMDKRLERFWGAVVLANTFTLATDRFPIPKWQSKAVETANKTFLLLCFIEVCTKLFGYGVRHFFSHGWYVSDFVLVTVSLFLRLTGGQSGVEALRVVRVFRIVVLASKIPALVQLIDVLVRCFQASVAVIILTTLAMYLYSILGMNLFGDLPSDEALARMGFPERVWDDLRRSPNFLSEVCPSCLQYNHNTNFLDFLSASRLLLQLVFGESLAIYVQELEYLGGNFWILMIFFASFYSLTVWVFMNLLIVTVLSNFDGASVDTSDKNAITLHDIEGFAHTWTALTIGVHQVPSVHLSSESLLERLKHTLQHHEENLENSVESAVYEDGPPELCGQLTVTIEKVTGLEQFLDTARPYCTVTIRGSDAKGTHTEVTESRKSRNGTASWKKAKGGNPGAVLQFHATGYHTECAIEVINGCQFGDRRLGSVFLNFGENHETDRLRGGCTERRSVVFNTAISPADLGNLLDEPPLGDPDRWDRFVMDAGEDTDSEEAEDNSAEASMPEGEDSTPASSMEEARRKAMEKKQRKDEKKLQQKWAKTAAKASLSPRAVQSSEATGGVGDGLATTCPQGWQQTEIQVHVNLLWEPKKSETPTLSFLADHLVNFAHKESSCGAEGWLDVSLEGSPFKRRFCYVQTVPEPAFKFYSNCQNQDDLERYGVRNKLHVTSISGRNLLSIRNGFTKRTMARKNKKAADFEIEFDSTHPHSKKKTLVKIGHISGTVLGAVGLIKRAGKGVQLLQLLQSMETAGVPAPFEELDEDEPAWEPDADPLDDPEQLPTAEPAKYMALQAVKVRQSSALDSMEVAQLERYQTVTVTHTVEFEGSVQLRTRVGWVSLTSPAGWSIMVAETNRNRHYHVKRDTTVGNSMKLSECSMDAANTPATVPKGAVVEVVDSQEDPETNTIRHRIVNCVAECWVSERDLEHSAPPEISCELEIAAWTPSGEQQKAQPLLEDTSTPRQLFRTASLKDTLSPTWSEAFAMNIFASSLTLHIRVFDDSSGTELGSAQLSVGSDGVPGPTLTENSITNTAENRSTALPEGSFAKLDVQLYAPVEENRQGEQATVRIPAGSVQLRLMYTEVYRREEQLLPLKRDAAIAGDLCTSLAMICGDTRQAKWRFQAANPRIARQWCTALRWIANGSPTQQRPCRLDIDPPPLLPRELMRAMHDVSLIDLPFSRASALLHGLYHRRVMGSHKPTLRLAVYTIFQLETHAWGQASTKSVRLRELNGSYLRDLRGLHFYNVLERLALLHYGKRRCLPYEDQVEEYQSEVGHIALQTVQCAAAAWVFRRRFGKTVGGHVWPWHSAWRSTSSATFLQATEAVCATRLRSLRILRGEIERFSKPTRKRADTIGETNASATDSLGAPASPVSSTPPTKNRRKILSGLSRRARGSKKAGESGGAAESQNEMQKSGGLSEEQRSEIIALWGSRGSLDVNDDALRVLLAQVFSEDEKNFVVNSALLEQLGAVGGELSLADLLSGMDQMLSDAPVADDDIDQLSDDCDSDVEDIINAAERPPGLALRSLAGDF